MRKANPGQHLFIGIQATEFDAATQRLITEVQPGGIVLFARNIETSPSLKALTRDLRASLSVPPVIAIDQECRRVNRLRAIVGELPDIAAVKQEGDFAAATQFGQSIGRCLRELGIDLDFAPVLDLELFDSQVDNALRGRCWGATPDEVITWAGAFIDGLGHAGVGACGKHFPGLGESHQDSHEYLPTITRSRQSLLTDDVLPYVRLQNRLAAIMVSHGHYVAFDGETPGPATLSKVVIQEILRRHVGFDGVVVTDDMEMGAIANVGPFIDAVLKTLEAGTDMLLICHCAEKILAAHEALSKAIESQHIDPQSIAASQIRIQKMRTNLHELVRRI